MTDPRIITLAEMAKHDTRADCWMAHNGQVYDVTKFLEDHPGGPEIMLEHSGKDMTTDFEDIGHSKSAREMMKKYLIGQLPDGEGKRLGQKSSSGDGSKSGSGSKSEGGGLLSLLMYAGPVVALAGAVYYQFFMVKG